MFKRILSIPEHSFFLFGPRQVGKSTLLSHVQTVLSIDLLNVEMQLSYSKDPNLLLRQVEAIPQEKGIVLIDEVQKVPSLLDIIQLLMEKKPNFQWIMSGSSARKLRRGAANLLGGRALYRTLHPLTMEELGSVFDLDQVLKFGSLPKMVTYLMNQQETLVQDLLRSYVITYLQEEVKAESLVRSLHGFQNFLEIAASQFAEQVNFSDIGRNCQVAYTTVREYYSILEDTLLGFVLYPYLKSARKRMSHAPKFYFFDNGVTRALVGNVGSEPSLSEKGRLFEQWFLQEVYRYNEYHKKNWKLFFWRTAHGAEVDCILTRGQEMLCVIECKYKKNLSNADLTGIRAFKEDYPNIPTYLVAPITTSQKVGDVLALPPQQMLIALQLM